jgi:hypothetical protein
VDETLATLNVVLAEKDWPPLTQSFDLHGALPPDAPRQPGAYVFLLDDGTQLRYPKGESALSTSARPLISRSGSESMCGTASWPRSRSRALSCFRTPRQGPQRGTGTAPPMTSP